MQIKRPPRISKVKQFIFNLQSAITKLLQSYLDYRSAAYTKFMFEKSATFTITLSDTVPLTGLYNSNAKKYFSNPRKYKDKNKFTLVRRKRQLLRPQQIFLETGSPTEN